MIPDGVEFFDFGELSTMKGIVEEYESGTVAVKTVILRFRNHVDVRVDYEDETCELRLSVASTSLEEFPDLALPTSDYFGLVVEEFWFMKNTRGYSDGHCLKFRNRKKNGPPHYMMLEAIPGEIALKFWYCAD
jgi:hypothetical protein